MADRTSDADGLPGRDELPEPVPVRPWVEKLDEPGPVPTPGLPPRDNEGRDGPEGHDDPELTRPGRAGGDGRRRCAAGHPDRARTARWSPDGKRLVSASDDDTVRVWNVATGESTALQHDDDAMAVGFSPDGPHPATGARDDKARILGPADGPAPAR